MPHLVLEYTDNLPPFDAGDVLRSLNQAVVAAGFAAQDIKSRAYFLTSYQIGDGNTHAGFVALRLHSRLEDAAKKKALAQDLLAVLKSHVPCGGHAVQFSVDMIQIDGDCYAKAVCP